MGYTHYWRHTRPFSERDWGIVCDYFNRIAQSGYASGISLSVDDEAHALSRHDLLEGFTRSLDGRETCLLNGVGGDAGETFVIYRDCPPAAAWTREAGFDFCKTGRRRYDAVVTGILSALEAQFPEHFSVLSDGGVDDWTPGVSLARAALAERAESVDAPWMVRFTAQWSQDILVGEAYHLYRHKNGAIGLVKEGRILAMFPGDSARKAQAVASRAMTGTEVSERPLFPENPFRQRLADADRLLRELYENHAAHGGVVPESSIPEDPDITKGPEDLS